MAGIKWANNYMMKQPIPEPKKAQRYIPVEHDIVEFNFNGDFRIKGWVKDKSIKNLFILILSSTSQYTPEQIGGLDHKIPGYFVGIDPRYTEFVKAKIETSREMAFLLLAQNALKDTALQEAHYKANFTEQDTGYVDVRQTEEVPNGAYRPSAPVAIAPAGHAGGMAMLNEIRPGGIIRRRIQEAIQDRNETRPPPEYANPLGLGNRINQIVERSRQQVEGDTGTQATTTSPYVFNYRQNPAQWLDEEPAARPTYEDLRNEQERDQIPVNLTTGQRLNNEE